MFVCFNVVLLINDILLHILIVVVASLLDSSFFFLWNDNNYYSSLLLYGQATLRCYCSARLHLNRSCERSLLQRKEAALHIPASNQPDRNSTCNKGQG